MVGVLGLVGGIIGVPTGMAVAAPGSGAIPPRWPGARVERVLDVHPDDDLVFTLESDTARAICRLRPLTDSAGDGTAVYALFGGNGLYGSPTAAAAERPDGDVATPVGIPIVVGPGEIGYVWRHAGPSPVYTRITPFALHDGPRADTPRALRYRVADVLGVGSHLLDPPDTGDITTLPAAPQRLIVVDPTVGEATLTIAHPPASDVSVLLLQATRAGYRVLDRARSGRGPAGRVGVRLAHPIDQAVLLRWEAGNASLEVTVTPIGGSASPDDGSPTSAPPPAGRHPADPGILLGTGGWTRITDDDGQPDSHWGQIAGASRGLLKVLMLDVDPAVVGAAAVEYRIQAQPYSVSRRAGLGFGATESDFDTQLIIEVNDVEAARAPVTLAATLGWHQMPVDPTLLRPGRNEIRFGVDGGDYVYVGLDFDSVHGRSASIVGDAVDWTSLRPAYHVGPGEYMIRLIIRE